jgi:hypothetical protein
MPLITMFLTSFISYYIQKGYLGSQFLPSTRVLVIGTLINSGFNSFTVYLVLHSLEITSAYPYTADLNQSPLLPILSVLCVVPLLLLWAWDARKED